MKKFQMQLVSLFLTLGLAAFCGNIGAHSQPLSASQRDTSRSLTLFANGHQVPATKLADGGDPVPKPMPLPGPTFRLTNDAPVALANLLTDGGDPVPKPMPLPGPTFRLTNGAPLATRAKLLTDGGDPVPKPMPLPGLRLLADGGDPVPKPMPLPGLSQMSPLV